MIGIIDYGLGNLTSVAGAVSKLGHTPVISDDADTLSSADKLILPGVGAFPDGMANLRDRGLLDLLNDLVVAQRKPILGICLGFQLLGKSSDEFGDTDGLGWVDSPITQITPTDPALRVPHVGWNDIEVTGDSILFDDVPSDALFYFVHKYKMEPAPSDVSMAICDYGGKFTAALQKSNIFGTQFHPEKSQQHGLKLLNNFLEKA